MIRVFLYTLASFGAAILVIPLVIALCKKQGWYDSLNVRKIHSGSIPRLGSLGFAPVFLIIAALYIRDVQPPLLSTYLPLFAPGMLIFLFGLIDDFVELAPKIKLLGQCAVSSIPVIFGFHFTRLGPLELGVLGPVITFCWLISAINAFNLIDGVDALCGGLSFSIALTLGISFQLEGSPSAGLPFILGGGVMGFLVYNKPRAKIFMGDGGSQFLGFIIAALPLVKPGKALEYNLFPLMITLSSIPLLDTIAAIWRRRREGRSFFSPDKRHLHHKLIDMGYTAKSILFFLLTIQGGLCGISLVAALWIEGARGFVILCGACAAMMVFFAIMHYTSRSVARVKGLAKD